MKLYFSLIAFCFLSFANAQIINIPDANFKAKLLAAYPSNSIAKNLAGNYFKIDVNNDREIQESEALNVNYLDVSNYASSLEDKIIDLTGVNYFINLKSLIFTINRVSSLNETPLIQLEALYCDNNLLTSLFVNGLGNLIGLKFSNNLVSTINLNGLTNLIQFSCGNNNFSNINISSLSSLKYLEIVANNLTNIDFSGLTNLLFIECA